MKTVLILGNGISRLQYLSEIKAYCGTGELWGSNFIYLEYGKYLTRIDGHPAVVKQGMQWSALHRYHYRCIHPEFTPEIYEELPEGLCGNSGIFLVTMALHEGFEKIIICGFDFGGKDIWTPDMHLRPVSNGLLKKWDHMLTHYPDANKRVEFWKIKPGYDQLSEDFIPIFNIAYEDNQKLICELRELQGQEVILPPMQPVSELTRGKEFYKDRLRRPMHRRSRITL